MKLIEAIIINNNMTFYSSEEVKQAREIIFKSSKCELLKASKEIGEKMNKEIKEQLKIVSDGVRLKLFMYGKEVVGVRSISFSQSLDEIPIIKLELLLLPNWSEE